MLKKIISFSIINLVLLGSFVLTPKAEAVLPVADSVTSGQIIADTVNTGANVTNISIEKILKGIAINAADQMLSKLSADVISWANNGYDGKPGFINNYGELIKGVEFDAIGSSFDIASGIAQSVQQKSNKAAAQRLATCESEAYEDYRNSLSLISEPRADYELEYQLTQCKIEASTNSSINSYNRCFRGNEQAGIDYATQIITGPSLQFFNDYFDGDASIENDFFGDFTDDYQLEFIKDAQIYYEFIYRKNQCLKELLIDTLGGDPIQTARNNYNLFQSGQINSTRAVAQTVADYGTEKLNDTKFQKLAAGGADLTLKLLGSQGRKDDFKNDITAGGWDGILSLTGEGSTDLALTTTAKVLVGNKSQDEVAIKEAALLLPTKLIDKTRCEAYVQDENGNNTSTCAREVIVTPGDLVAGQVTTSLSSEFSKGEAFGDDLALVLIKNLGNVVSGLADVGLSQLTNAAVGFFFDSNDDDIQKIISSGSGTDFQSRFNAVGVQTNADSTFLGQKISRSTSQGRGLAIPSGIGGPEDANPQIIINFREELESNLSLAIQEKDHYDNIRDLTKDIVDTILQFEKCIPGPDYDWENRINDSLDTSDDSVKIGINEMKAMVKDPQVTIPGGVEMRDQIEIIFNTARQNKSAAELRRQQLSRVINTMTFIKSEIKIDFDLAKKEYNNNLVLFEEDWNNLSELQKISILEYLVKNQYYINPQYVIDNGQTILTDSAIAEDEEKIRSAAITQAWGIWRSTTADEEKLNLRETFYAIQNDLSNVQFVNIARTQFDEMKVNIDNSFKIALDCMVFKSFALGKTRAELATLVNNQDKELGEKIIELSEFISTFNPGQVSLKIESDGLFNNTLSGDIPGFKVDTVLPDNTLRIFLESERNLQLNNGDSLFSTPTMTIASVIENSILGFKTELEKQEYFDDYYPSDWVQYGYTGNRLSVSEIYKHDIMRYRGSRGSNGLKGSLFCRVPGKFDRFGDSDDGDDTSLCFNGLWYSISKLNLQLIISEINV